MFEITERLARERRARLAAERILEQKKRELYAANQQLSQHARALSEQVVAQRQGLELALSEAETLKGQNSRVLSDLERANAAAAMAQRRLWAALETFRDGFAVFDRELRLVVANRAYLAVFRGQDSVGRGTGYEQILRLAAGTGIVDLEGQAEADWHREMMARVLQEQIAPRVIRLATGAVVRLIDRRSEDGDLVSLAIDITETIRREEELEKARQEAEAATRAKSAFLANMTHELRTPMNGVVGMAELLCEGDLTEEQRLYAETIRSSGEALLAIINDVLDYSKAEAERLQLFPEPFDLERMIHEVMLLVQPGANAKGLSLILDYDLGLPTRFIADPGRMRQILMNLVGNAVKFTNSGHVLVRVVGMAVLAATWRLQLTVEDTGIGISPEHAEMIFGEFNQVQSQANRKYEGTGLGLAITRQLVNLMGGRIWVDSEAGRGASFGVDLSLPAAEDGAPGPASIAGAGHSLLLMDATLDRAVLERQLSALHFPPTVARSASDARRLIERGRPYAALFVDEALVDQLEAVAGPVAEGRVGGIPVVLVWSGSDRGHHMTAAVLRKPVLRSDLRGVLADLAETAAARQSGSAPPGAQTRQMRVLAAEDNRTNQLVFRKMVKDFDIDLTFADNGREAVELWQRLRPDLIFMDISMPEMDGRDAAREIRRIEQETGLGRVPIVALTAHALEGDAEAILASGIDHYLTKPLRKSAIAEFIGRLCPDGARPPFPAGVQADPAVPGTAPMATGEGPALAAPAPRGGAGPPEAAPEG